MNSNLSKTGTIDVVKNLAVIKDVAVKSFHSKKSVNIRLSIKKNWKFENFE